MQLEQCRACLAIKKNVRSIYDIQENYTYAHMLTSLTNIKIGENDGITDKICLRCRKKLLEAFEFKVMIERSDANLRNETNVKKIVFYNLKDIKIKIEIADCDKIIPKVEKDIITDHFKAGETSFSYNDTSIMKVIPSPKVTKEGPLSVIDFLNTIKEESENEFEGTYVVDDNYGAMSNYQDKDYLDTSLIQRMRKNKKKKTKIREKIKRKTCNNIKYKDKLEIITKPIKPVFLNDIRVLPTKAYYDKPTTKKKYKRARKEMCNFCGKMTTSIKHHLLTHTGERSYKCDVCGKGFLTAATLTKHKQRHISSTDRSFKCSQCVATFGCKEALKSHMISHSEDKKYICKICSKPFKRKNALRRHELMHNVANKNIKCDLCNMSFFSKYGLNHHMRVHTGERPYNCEICSQPYSYKHDFNRHCFKKHGVFLKRRSIYVMNEEVLKSERSLMRDLMLKIHGFGKDGENINPFEGPQAAQAFEQTVKVLKAKQIPVEFHI